MNQQVNLYHPIFRRQEKKFSATAMLQAAGIMVVGVALIYGYAWWRVDALKAQVARAERDHASALSQLQTIEREIGGTPSNPQVAADVRALEAQIAASGQLRHLLRGDDFARGQGYSEYFAAFARQHIAGISLTGFSITGAGKQIVLQGRSSSPELVPQYLQRLSSEPILAGARFEVFQMNRPKNAGHVEFVVKTVENAQTPPTGERRRP